MAKTLREYPQKILIGNNEGKPIYLSAPSWDCGWYWDFGYLGNQQCHYHVDGLTTIGKYDGEKFTVRRVNLFDGFKEHFGSSLIVNNDRKLWTLCELFKTFYSLREIAQVYGRGGSHYSTNPIADKIKNPSEVQRINEILMPELFDEIYKILLAE